MDYASKLATNNRLARHLRRSRLPGFACGGSKRPDDRADRFGTQYRLDLGPVGYISSLDGMAGIFAGSPQNETTALLTFYSDTTTLRVINNSPLRIVNREGTMTVYRHDQPNGDFGHPDSFRAGTPVMVTTLRHQVILD